MKKTKNSVMKEQIGEKTAVSDELSFGSGKDTIKSSRGKIAKYILERDSTSKAEIFNNLGLSMPTVLHSIKDLKKQGVVYDAGEYESTGGRRAKSLSIKPGGKLAAGIRITKGTVRYCVVDIAGNIVARSERKRQFDSNVFYPMNIALDMQDLIMKVAKRKSRITGIGITVPVNFNETPGNLLISENMNIYDYDLCKIKNELNVLGYNVRFFSEPYASAVAQFWLGPKNACYLYLDEVVGGVLKVNGKYYSGTGIQGAGFGHMIIDPSGEPCFCGRRGCVNVYCSSMALASYAGGDLGLFEKKLEEKDEETIENWNLYLEAVAVTAANLRTLFGCDVFIGGACSPIIERHRIELEFKLRSYDKSEIDMSFLHYAQFGEDSPNIGAAYCFVDEFIDNL